MTRRIWVAALLTTLLGGVAIAQNAAVIEQRKKLFEEMDKGADDLDDMVRGKKKFDLAVVQKTLGTIVDDTKKVATLFPDDSKSGKTRALPRVWEEKARFDRQMDAYATETAAAAGGIKDEKTFRAAMPKVFGDCKVCHDDFRARRR